MCNAYNALHITHCWIIRYEVWGNRILKASHLHFQICIGSQFAANHSHDCNHHKHKLCLLFHMGQFHSIQSSFSFFYALATYLHLNLSNLWLLNFQLVIRKPSFLTSIALHLPKCLPFSMNSRIYSKFLFHHHLSSSSVVTSISMLIPI